LVIGQTARKSVKALFQYILSVAVNGGGSSILRTCVVAERVVICGCVSESL
jgi:hypothetical protein